MLNAGSCSRQVGLIAVIMIVVVVVVIVDQYYHSNTSNSIIIIIIIIQFAVFTVILGSKEDLLKFTASDYVHIQPL